jgi:hypothetical protein
MCSAVEHGTECLCKELVLHLCSPAFLLHCSMWGMVALILVHGIGGTVGKIESLGILSWHWDVQHRKGHYCRLTQRIEDMGARS